MSNIVRSNELAPAVRTLLGYLDDLRRTKFDDASTKLRLVVNYCQKDDVVRNLAELLRTRIPTELLHELLASETLQVPHDPRDAMGLCYTLVYHIKQGWKYELRELLTRAMFAAPGGMDARWDRFKAQLVDPLVVNGEKILRHVEGWAAAQPDGTLVDPNEVFLAALAALGPAAAAPAATSTSTTTRATASTATPGASTATPGASTATPGASTATPATASSPASALGRVADERPLPDGVTVPAPLEATTGDLRVEAALLGLELAKQAPSAARLEALLASFDAAPAPLRAGLATLLAPALVRLARAATPPEAATSPAPTKAEEGPTTKPVKRPTTKSVKKADAKAKKPETKRRSR